MPSENAGHIDSVESWISKSSVKEVSKEWFNWIAINIWGVSSAGRARRSQCRGRGFNPHTLHQIQYDRQFRLTVVLFTLQLEK